MRVHRNHVDLAGNSLYRPHQVPGVLRIVVDPGQERVLEEDGSTSVDVGGLTQGPEQDLSGDNAG
jgi:hypothetical protein